jgi:ABC-type transport system involved in multi-copper enzyme maturation permease subunit
MSAETHLEVYRPFRGTLHEHPLRFLSLWRSGLRTALKQRLALFLLYLPALITTVIMSFIVYVKFAVEDMVQNSPQDALDFQGQIAQGIARAQAENALAQAEKMFGVVKLILGFAEGLGIFALLAVAWFASPLFCEDRKAGAHQLYFARPLTRLDYALGKFLIAATFSAFAILVPLLVICLMAVLCSPEWSFLKEEWDVILRSIAFALVWTVVVSSLVLLASSLASRRAFALLGVFGVAVLSIPVAALLGSEVNPKFFALALMIDLFALAQHIFGEVDPEVPVGAGAAWTAVSALVLVSWTVIWLRLRRLEVVA